MLIVEGVAHGEDAPELAGGSDYEQVYGADVHTLETVVRKCKDIKGKVDPLIAAEVMDWDPCMEGVSHYFLGSRVEYQSSFCLYHV